MTSLGVVAPSLVHAQQEPVRAAASDPYWVARYYNNTQLAGDPVLQRNEQSLDYNWGNGSPDPAVNSNNFSARWTRYLYLGEGTYRFTVTTDDGARLFIDDRVVVDQWNVQAERTFVVDRNLTAGHHLIRVEYFEQTGKAKIRLTWERLGANPPPVVNGWRGEYFNNRDLLGDPALVRDDSSIDFRWGTGSPAPGTIQSDNFSVRWNRSLDLAAGNYRFTVTTDDGARLWVNNAHIINEWREQGERTYSSDIYLPGGNVPVRLEYFDAMGESVVRLQWQRIDGGGGGGGGDQDSSDADWFGQYYGNAELSGSPAFERRDRNIDFDWGSGGPNGGFKTDWFSIRWTRTYWTPEGKTKFTAEVDDGVRIFVDGELILDKWFAQTRTKYTVSKRLSRGDHTVVVEYQEQTGQASIKVTVSPPQTAVHNPVGNIITCVPPQPQNYAWIKIYRLGGNGEWESMGRGIGSFSSTGYLKLDGYPVDTNRYGDRGHPYRVEKWIDGSLVESTGNFQAGQPEFRVRAFADNYTPWGCAKP
jgi:hypothetical protein